MEKGKWQLVILFLAYHNKITVCILGKINEALGFNQAHLVIENIECEFVCVYVCVWNKVNNKGPFALR